MKRGSVRKYVLAAVLAATMTATGGAARAAEDAKPPTIEAVMKRLGYSEEDKTALLAGKIVATDLKRTRDDQLIAAVAMQLNAPIATLAENVRKGLNIEGDKDVSAFGKVSGKGAAEAFEKARYTGDDSDEIAKLIAVKADGTFNLSKSEMEGLQKALQGLDADDPTAAEKASKAYQAILAGRYQAYVEKGLDGIANYDAGPVLEPGKELRAAYDQAKPFLEEYFPAFGQALGTFPNDQPTDITSDFYWIKRNVEGRPDFILAHQMVQSGEGFVLLSQRQYFVGHTYESLQVIAVALPTEKGSAVFYANSTYTDKITGFFSGVAESVGQSRTKEDLVKYFKEARKDL